MPNEQLQRARPMIYGIGLVVAAALVSSATLVARGGTPMSAALLAAIGPSLLLGMIGGTSRFLCRAMPLRSAGLLERLEKIELYAKDSRVAILRDGSRLPVSRSGYASLRELL